MTQTAIQCWAWWQYQVLRRRLSRYREEQQVLAKRYAVDGCDPAPYGEATATRVRDLGSRCQEPVTYAATSGTTHEPKQLLYPQHRVRAIQQTYVAQTVLAYQHMGLRKPAFYFLTSMAKDDSVSNLMAREPLSTLISRYILSQSIVHIPDVARLCGQYRQDALHLALMVLSAPTVIAMPNPSSLYVILQNASRDWDSVRTAINGMLEEGWLEAFHQRMGLAVKPREATLRQFLSQNACPPVHELLPDLKLIYCWDGGYLDPFIDNLQRQLAEITPAFYPMFSMSTETVAYLIYPQVTTEGGLPIYPHVCYEFLPEAVDPTATHVVKPWDLQVGSEYSMIVSDHYGLKRYDTEDMFACVGFKRQTPILRFQGRAGLNYSFTGEKITDKQLLEVYDIVRKHATYPNMVLTCFPKRNDGGIPGYVFVQVIGSTTTLPAALPATVFDEALSEINPEYAHKRHTGRLAMPEVIVEHYEQFLARLANVGRQHKASATQFKPLPLYQIFWEDLGNQEGKR